MKKLIIIGAGIAILILISVLSWQHFRDANIRQKICGSWRASNAEPSFMMTFAPDGSFWFGMSPYHNGFSGTWRVSDGFVFMTTTSFYNNGRQSRIISHLRLNISRLDDHQLVCERNRLDDHNQLARESDGCEAMSDTIRLSR